MSNKSSNIVFSVVSQPLPKLAYTNRVFVSKKDFDFFTTFSNSDSQKCIEDPFVNVFCGPIPQVKWTKVCMMVPCDDMVDGTIGLNQLQRKDCGVLLNENVSVRTYTNSGVILLNLHLEVEPLINKKIDLSTLDLDELSVAFYQVYNDQVFHKKNTIAMDYNGLKLLISVMFIQTENNFPSDLGTLKSTTNLTWQKKPRGPIGSTDMESFIRGSTGPTRT
jgi:hypothetical protein